MMAHIEAAANTFGAHISRTRKKKNDKNYTLVWGFDICCGGFACVIKLSETCPARNKFALLGSSATLLIPTVFVFIVHAFFIALMLFMVEHYSQGSASAPTSRISGRQSVNGCVDRWGGLVGRWMSVAGGSRLSFLPFLWRLLNCPSQDSENLEPVEHRNKTRDIPTLGQKQQKTKNQQPNNIPCKQRWKKKSEVVGDSNRTRPTLLYSHPKLTTTWTLQKKS